MSIIVTASHNNFSIGGDMLAGDGNRTYTPRLLPALMVAFLLLPFHRALAHALIIDSAPAAASTVAAGDVPIRLHFNSRIDRARSKLTLFSPDGKESVLKTDADSSPEDLNSVATGLAPGAWRLRWQVLSVDGHITRGDIPFTVH